MRGGRTWLLLAGIALLAVVALVVSASRALTVRTYAIDVPDLIGVATVAPSQTACEGPITSSHAFRRVGVWTGATTGTATGIVEIEAAASHRVLASSGEMSLDAGVAERTPSLSRAVAADQPVVVCIAARRNSLTVGGSQAAQPGVATTGVVAGEQFSLVLLTGPRSGSLLSWLPTAFTRASLWRPSWMGTWTFWLLAGALLATFGVGVVAVTSAVAADDEEYPPSRDDGGGVPPSSGDRSEAGQDRPQTVP
jgi:hypothetical protein